MLYQLNHGDIDLSASASARATPPSTQKALWKNNMKLYAAVCKRLFYADNPTMTQHKYLSNSVFLDHLQGKQRVYGEKKRLLNTQPFLPDLIYLFLEKGKNNN